MITQYAPIVVFTYNRLNHTRKLINSLKKNKISSYSDLIIFSDAPKNDENNYKVLEVRKYINSIKGFNSIEIIERKYNFGLSKNILTGINSVFNKYDKIIVLEDDLEVNSYFLDYMNEALIKYKNTNNISGITGYSYFDLNEFPFTYFLNLTCSWSWATWKHKWKEFNISEIDLHKIINNKSIHKNYNFENSYDFVKICKDQLNNKINSWAIYWYTHNYINNYLTLYPNKSLVSNSGFDGSGTHYKSKKNIKNDSKNISSTYNFKLTDEIYENFEIRKYIASKIKPSKMKYFKKILYNKLNPLILIKLIQLINRFKLLFLKKEIGKGTYIDKTVHVTGWKSISIGNNCGISENSWLNVNDRLNNQTQIRIKNNCYIGRRNFFSSGKLIEIGNFCMTGINCSFLGSNHKIDNPLIPYISSGTTNNSEIILEDNVWLGANVTIIGNVRIGRGSIIGAGSVVTKSIPSFTIAVGSPAVVIKKYNFEMQKWVNTNEFDENISNVIPFNEKDYEKILCENYNSNKINMPFVACSKNFGDL